ncbi:MAG: S-methyl-5'-thioinosine phosphorylase [Bacillota bacterium]
MKAAIIGGTGIYKIGAGFLPAKIITPYGEVVVNSLTLAENQKELAFLARHGANHKLPPHKINYRANIWALKELGVTHVFAINAVGSLNPRQKPGELTLFTDFIDATKNRPATFFDGQTGVIHTSMTDPYCFELRRLIAEQGKAKGLQFHTGIYIGTEGPRFETAAEISAYRQWGADLVGMTGIPEVILAKELGLCYAGIGIITNWATGIAHDHQKKEILGAVEENKKILTEFLIELIQNSELNQNNCHCQNATMNM